MKNNINHMKTNYLLCFDDSMEFKNALNFACNQAKKISGTVTLLHVLEKANFRHWKGVESIMRKEAKEKAKLLLKQISKKIKIDFNIKPELIYREGDKVEQIMDVIARDSNINSLVLGSVILKSST